MSGKSMLRFGHNATRMSIITSHEQIWINALIRSKQDLTCFTAKQAVEWIARVPNLGGNPRKHKPNVIKFNYTLRKSKQFECITTGKKTKTGNQWRLIQ